MFQSYELMSLHSLHFFQSGGHDLNQPQLAEWLQPKKCMGVS